jgi:hypothetical protein
VTDAWWEVCGNTTEPDGSERYLRHSTVNRSETIASAVDVSTRAREKLFRRNRSTG